MKDPLSDGDLAKLKERFARLKWKLDEVIEVQIKFEPASGPKSVQRLSGFRVTSPDALNVINLDRTNYGLTALPPYEGWESYFAKFQVYLKDWRKIVGRRAVARLGMRYVNRFDIPFEDGFVAVADYLSFRPPEPDFLDEPNKGGSTQIISGFKDDRIGVTLGVATMESPIVDHLGVALDIDLYRDNVDVPQTDDDITSLLELMRVRRTEIFEKCSTDKARELIR